MCQAVKCAKCGKTTWAGCGNHVDQVMRNVPVSNRCACDRKTPPGWSRAHQRTPAPVGWGACSAAEAVWARSGRASDPLRAHDRPSYATFKIRRH